MPMKNPPHPGDLIRTEVIEAARSQRLEGGGGVEGSTRNPLRPATRQGRFDC